MQCSLKYYFRNVLHLDPELTSKNLLFGVAFHRTMDHLAKLRIANQEIQRSETREFFEREWNNQILCNRNIDFETDDEADSLKTKGMEMINAYEWDGSRIIGHSEAFSVNIPGVNLPVIGEFDMVVEDENGDATIVDFKTSGRKWAEDKPSKDMQATLYTYAYRQTTGRSANFRFDVITKGKTPALQKLPTSRTQDDYGRMIKVFQSVEKGIDAGVFLPNEASFFCSGCEFAKNCAGWGKCQKVA
jgi:putative RecB family exonuclease